MKINANIFPQLRALCWNRPDNTIVDGREAFDLYERNWRFVDEAALTPQERALLDDLTEKYGHGVFLAA